MFSKSTIDTKLAVALLNLGACYKQDLVLYARQFVHENRARSVINERLDEGYFELLQISKKKKGKGDYEVIALTSKGRKAILDVLEEDENYYREVYEDNERDFRTSSTESLRAALTMSRIKLMFEMADVPSFNTNKPKLSDLYYTIVDRHIIEHGEVTERSADRKYMVNLSPREMDELLKRGIFYNMKEFREFTKEKYGEEIDTVFSSRAKGIYISFDKILVVYAPNRGDNKIFRVGVDFEKKLLRALEIFGNITNAYRKLPKLSLLSKSRYDGKMYYSNLKESHPYALVISDGDSMVYSMAVGNPSGLIKGVDFNELDDKRDKYHKKNKKEPKMIWFKGNGAIYPRVFVTPFTQNGIGSLKYLCDVSAEEWVLASKALFAKSEHFEPSDNPIYPANELGKYKTSAIYMPVFEVNELYQLGQKRYSPVILTYKDMADAISHSLRQEVKFYDAETMLPIPKDEVLIYDEYGYPKGMHLLEIKLHQQGLTCDKKELNNLPALQGYEYNKFYNEIARGNINLDYLIPRLNTKELIPKEPKKRHLKRRMTTVLGTEIAKMIEDAAKLHNMTPSSYIRTRIYDIAKKDAEEYRAQNNKKEMPLKKAKM